MKLLRKTYLYTFRWLLPVVLIGSVFCFYMIEYISHEETDEFLTYEMQRTVSYHSEHNQLPEFHKVAEIIPGENLSSPVFKDTSLLESADDEYVPYRELRFTIIHNEKPFTIVLRHLLLGTDDIIEGTLLIVLGLIALFSMFIIVTLHYSDRTVWKPFYSTLNSLKRHSFKDPVPLFAQTKIEEFNELNSTLEKILLRLSSDYIHNKEFTENISHELQTHLAIIKLNTEALINTGISDVQKEEVQKIYAATMSLSQIQKSLFLLSKLNNDEFDSKTSINFKQLISNAIENFQEAIDERNISIKTQLAHTELRMDKGLAEILINNLLKNAIKHNISNGFINVVFSEHRLIIKNSGAKTVGTDTENLIARYSKGKTGNLGLGLSIVEEVCIINHFQLTYQMKDENVHELTVTF